MSNERMVTHFVGDDCLGGHRQPERTTEAPIRIICVRGPRPTCSACGVATGTLQCDWPTGSGKTCDRYLCSRCAVTQPPVFGEQRVDHCPGHGDGV